MSTFSMKKFFLNSIVILACLIFSACSTYVTSPNHYYYNKQGQRVGSVGYNPEGLGDLVKMRRDNALAKIEEYCEDGPYNILRDERANFNSREGHHETDLQSFGSEDLHFIDFICTAGAVDPKTISSDFILDPFPPKVKKVKVEENRGFLGRGHQEDSSDVDSDDENNVENNYENDDEYEAENEDEDS